MNALSMPGLAKLRPVRDRVRPPGSLRPTMVRLHFRTAISILELVDGRTLYRPPAPAARSAPSVGFAMSRAIGRPPSPGAVVRVSCPPSFLLTLVDPARHREVVEALDAAPAWTWPRGWPCGTWSGTPGLASRTAPGLPITRTGYTIAPCLRRRGARWPSASAPARPGLGRMTVGQRVAIVMVPRARSARSFISLMARCGRSS